MTDTVHIVFLGTGAAAPSLSRGLPSLAIIRENRIVLCDCGEATQLKLMQAGLSPAKIRTILISHLHGDHIFGLPGFLSSQQLLGREAPLSIYGPPGIQNFIDCMSQVSKYAVEYPLNIIELSPDNKENFREGQFLISSQNVLHSSPCLGYRLQESDKPGKFDADKANELGIPDGPERAKLVGGETIEFNGKTVHPSDVVGPSQPGRILTYCTDTRPCDAVLELAKECDLLIHDATFSDAYADRAEPTFHSTSRQAAEIAKQAHAQKLALWHLSIRVHGEEERALLEQAREVFPQSYLPNDLDLWDVPRRQVS